MIRKKDQKWKLNYYYYYYYLACSWNPKTTHTKKKVFIFLLLLRCCCIMFNIFNEKWSVVLLLYWVLGIRKRFVLWRLCYQRIWWCLQAFVFPTTPTTVACFQVIFYSYFLDFFFIIFACCCSWIAIIYLFVYFSHLSLHKMIMMVIIRK